jgi:asparagine synthase (glutamine-hydrolysing)
MSDCLAHRGPDSRGTWAEAETGIAFGHLRLAIVDLSPMGHQPMLSADERYVINYNGEVFNFQSLRAELQSKGHSFRGTSDTEVMLASISEWGVQGAVERFVGQFALALWDRQERTLHLIRDRLGIKPLYYGWMNGVLIFGSELKALRAYPNFDAPINRQALTLFLRHNCVPAPYSIYEGIFKLPPATILTVHEGQRDAEPIPYWSATDVIDRAKANPFTGSLSDAQAELDAILRDAVKIRMIADVPLGAFLSGGVDSSTVVALMQSQSDRPVKTFSIGFQEGDFNEAKYARAVAQHLGTDHTELTVTPQEALDVIPRLPTLYDEPFADSSQIPTFLVSQLARQHVTVSLSGDGGDELFAGYNRHVWVPSIANKTRRLPKIMRQLTAKSITTLSPRSWDTLFSTLSPVLPSRARQRQVGYKLYKLADALAAGEPEAIYRGLISDWKNPSSIVQNAHGEPDTLLTTLNGHPHLPDFTEKMMLLDLITYLPDDILTKVDRASMGVSLEARVPILDHRVVEFAWRLPLDMKLREGQSKWLLRQVLYQYVPKELIERPKSGFAVPIADWLRRPLRDWVEDLLDSTRLQNEGYFKPEPIQHHWREHLDGKRDWSDQLWDVLMFQSWLQSTRETVSYP